MKKSLFAMAIVGFLVLSGFYIIGEKSGIETKQTVVAEERTDNDNDGLLAWEETLYGTNPNNPDTDGDGTPDGEEVALDRDPTIAGPDDAFKVVPPVITTEMTEEEMLALEREFLNDYLKERAGEVEELTITDLLGEYDPGEITAHYTLNNVHSISVESDDDIRAYGNAMGSIFNKYADEKEYYSEFEIFEAALRDNDPSQMGKLKLMSVAYDNLARELLALEVPFGNAENHLVFVNAYDVLSQAVAGMADFFDNPVRGGGAYQAYLVHIAAIKAAFMATTDYFTRYDILFEEGEAGIVFNMPAFVTASDVRNMNLDNESI